MEGLTSNNKFFTRNIDRVCSWRRTRLRTSQLRRALLENFERISISHPGDLAFPLTSYRLVFSLSFFTKNQITGRGILVCRPNRLYVPKNVIKTSCCKMRHVRASHLMSSFLLFNRDSSILMHCHPLPFLAKTSDILWHSAWII